MRESVKVSLLQSRRDIEVETKARMAAARVRIERVGNLIDKAYEDKLEGRIDADYFNRKRLEWEAQRTEAALEIQRLTRASARSLDMALVVLELANQAYDLFIEEEPAERRAMLEVLLSNCEMAAGRLHPTCRRPFSLLAEPAKTVSEEGPPSDGSAGGHPRWSG